MDNRSVIGLNRSLRRRLTAGSKHLCEVSEPLAAWIETCGRCELKVEWGRSIYEALVRAIAHQQLHSKAAESILARMCNAFPKTSFPTEKEIASTSLDQLRAFGFSQAKVVAIQGIAQASLEKSIPTRTIAEQMSDAELIDSLIPLRGVGKWTVEMILIFTLGRMDVMPVDDFGVKSGLKTLLELEDLPKRQGFAIATDDWTPYRTIGAWYLWRLADNY